MQCMVQLTNKKKTQERRLFLCIVNAFQCKIGSYIIKIKIYVSAYI